MNYSNELSLQDEQRRFQTNSFCILFKVLNSGWLNRRVASTSMNRESSRSHAVFTVALESKVGQLLNIL